MLNERESLLLKSEIPSEEETHSLFEKIKRDPEKIEWEVLAYHWPYASRRQRTLQKNAFYCAVVPFLLLFATSSFDIVKTITEPWVWGIVIFLGAFGYYFSGLTVFNYHRHHYMLSKHGLITEQHSYSPKSATNVAKKMVGVLAVLTVLTVIMIGPVALVGAGGLGITWLMLANVNFEKYGLMQRVCKHDDIFFLREHDDSDEKRDYFRLYHRYYSINFYEDKIIKLNTFAYMHTDVYCEAGKKSDIIEFFNQHHPWREIISDKMNLFDDDISFVAPREIRELVSRTSLYSNAE
ncbi:hypothetical protein [Photobacterium salinisoli]|uniref:hypothetical protein n=1 Tax=Photobacterium salinisoli TaxID=1616783 RepID=UPI000EA250F5|nr:hypothetical protein [Photobacterium salinisoli]